METKTDRKVSFLARKMRYSTASELVDLTGDDDIRVQALYVSDCTHTPGCRACVHTEDYEWELFMTEFWDKNPSEIDEYVRNSANDEESDVSDTESSDSDEDSNVPENEEESEEPEPNWGNCPICFEELAKCDVMVTTICGHVFCENCITTCINSNNTCPKCRTHLQLNMIHPVFLK